NGGNIKNCSFSGKLTGAGVTGGIAGLNGSRAGILQCSSEGEVSGIHMVGGIAGENTGVISDCTNGADVNAAEDWLELEERKEKERNLAGMVDTVQEKMDRGSDFGGICGYSSGIIAGCRNSATVGYQHAGRNVGGIVGRQSGKVILSVNDGKVYGKQDVGGIAGQFEPYTVYEDVEELDQKVGELHDLMAQMIDDMEAMGDDLHGDFQGLNRESREAGDTADVLMDEMRDVIKKNVDIVNQLAQRIDYAMNHIAVVKDHLNKALGSADRMLGDLDQVKTDLDLPGQMSGEAYDAARDRRLVIQSSAGGILTADNPSPSEGARVVFTMTAEQGYRLAKLLRTPYGKETLDETEKVQDNKYIIDSMPAENQTVTALFEYVGGEYIVESNAGGKAVLTPDQTQLTIMPAAGYAAESVRIDGGGNVLSEGADTVSLSREECGHPRRIFVQFRKTEEPQPVIFDENVARVSAVSGVGGTVSCDQPVIKAGETIRITVADDPHYVLSSLTVGESDNLADPAGNHVIEYTPEELPGGDVEICAQFRPVTVITVSGQIGGRAYYAADGQDVIITVSEDTGYQLEELHLTTAD
ncbi:MAG: hypothetical protein J6Z35_05500, partial [Lachnospiraceae bacterium]|nr:hypothetical protein [Lachnospiraceae bacterium]